MLVKLGIYASCLIVTAQVCFEAEQCVRNLERSSCSQSPAFVVSQLKGFRQGQGLAIAAAKQVGGRHLVFGKVSLHIRHRVKAPFVHDGCMMHIRRQRNTY